MKRIVITGGPCSGKSTVLRHIKEHYPLVQTVPEVASVILEGGFPVPNRDTDWNPEWQAYFQSAVLPLQLAMENSWQTVAEAADSQLLICDRGLLDGAAYTPGGLSAYLAVYGLDLAESLRRYAAVIHLESLATARPDEYGTVGNANRYEPLVEAQALEYRTRDAWNRHPQYHLVPGGDTVKAKISTACTIIDQLLGQAQ